MMRAASSPLEPLNKNILLAGEMIADKWKIGEKIGEGTFSQIYSAYSIENRDKVAVKVEAPSSLKPVLEWESLILKSLQDCSYVCRYYYHGKHGDSTVLVMELLGDSMSMLRMSPDSIYGVPLAKSVSVGLEMLDCIEAFHRHGYVHRDIKASNFALSALPDRNPLRQQRYYIIDFGLSRQHIGEDRQVLPARFVAEFRGTSMYASLSSHRRQELGPKDDLWSWFYLVMDFMRGELPWAADAQLKNRQTVLSLKEYYTETNPNLLVEGLPGAMQLVEMMGYLQSLKYEDFPDYAKIRKYLQAVGGSSLVLDSNDSGNEDLCADKKESQAVAAVSLIDWSAITSERERALAWVDKADELKHSDGASEALLTIAKRYKMFFDSDGLLFDEQVRIQSAVYRIEKKLRARSSFLAPPPIQSFVKRRQSEQKMRSDALRKRREKDYQVRQSLEIKNEKKMALAASIQPSSDAVDGIASGEGASGVENGEKCSSLQPHKSESSMEFSDIEDTGKRRNAPGAAEITIPASQPQVPIVDVRPPTAAGSVPLTQLSHLAPAASPGSRWNRTPNYSGAIPPPPSPPWILNPAQRSGLFEHRPPPPPPLSRQHPTKGGVQPPFVPPNDVSVHHPPPLHSSMPEKRYALVPDQHYGVPVEVRKDTIYGYQQPLQERNGYSSVRQHKSETREDRGYGIQQIKKSLQDSVRDRQYDAVRETREDRGYSSYQRHQNKSPRDSDRRYDVRTENREDRGYTSNRRSPQETNACALDPHYDAPINSTEERGYGVQLPQKPQKSPRTNQEQYLSGGHRQNKERFYEGKRSRSFSQSRSSRRERGRSRRRSCSRSSSRSRSKSYSVSSSRSRSPRNRSHCHTNRAYADGRRETKEVRSERVHSRRQRSRSCSSSRSSSSQSPSASPPAKRYRRRSSDRSPLQSSRRHSSHSTLRHPSHSTTEYLKDHPEEVVKDYLKEYTKGYSKKFAKDYSREYVKDHPKKYAKEYVRNYPKKHFSKNFPKEHVKDYRWDSHSLDPQYQRRSSSQDRHQSHPRDYDREDEPKGVDVRFKPAPAPEKLRRPTRWQPRP